MTKRRHPSAEEASPSQSDPFPKYITIEDDDDGGSGLDDIDLVSLTIDEQGEDDDLGEASLHPQGSSDVPEGYVAISSVNKAGETLRPGSRVELHSEDFLRITRIYHKQSANQHIVQGNLMRRTNRADCMLLKKLNELYLVLQSTSSKQNPALEDCVVTLPLSDVKCARNIVITNYPFPDLSWRESYSYNSSVNTEEKAHIRDNLRLVCRWVVTDELDGKRLTGGSTRRVSEKEADEGARMSKQQHLDNFLGIKRKKHICCTHAARLQADEDFVSLLDNPPPQTARPTTHAEVIDLTSDSEEISVSVHRDIKDTINRIALEKSTTSKRQRNSEPANQGERGLFNTNKVLSDSARNLRGKSFTPDGAVRRQPIQIKYTYADICAGAGGMASGAEQAGLKIQFLLDHWDVACETLRWNFPGSKVLLEDIYTFCTKKHKFDWEVVDILHISFPCQPHSRLNPYDIDHGKNPDNIAVGFSTIDILQRCRPRIVTFEQTSHIFTRNDGLFFRVIVKHLTDMGYSVRWRNCCMDGYRNVHARKRLIVIASCPGETLPTFPEPTNGLGLGKLPLTTINKVLKKVHGYEGDVPAIMRSSKPRYELPYDGNTPLRKCITCNGGEGNIHPCGTRSFTLQELSALQAFLLHHKFAGSKSNIVKQIGNAVPSCFSKTLFAHIIKTLRESDKNFVEWARASTQDGAIEID